ncbi:hypothetical protein D9Q98_004875 [Chlorella vulgaris]|uniref:RecF/RecN/SMC N-terminal domain-containing protein n=1 Tax=Chlorella vulgaris TaxID=3077 RepID=A0A9D4TP03_CHLVU|nr:hypothetical protein D9Q98_004875 [Chlorella vulgaris]
MSLSLANARTLYQGAQIAKTFKPNADTGFEGGLFSGLVSKVERNVTDADGVRWPILFLITYEDGEKEHLTLQELEVCLVDKPGMQRRKDKLLAAVTASMHDENGAGPEPQPKHHKRAAEVLGESTQQHSGSDTGQERRSRREGKRRMDDQFEYEDPRDAKRGTGAGGSGSGSAAAAIRSRLGIRQPLPGGAAAAAAAANLTSESQEDYPVGEAGMRLAGLPGHLKRIEVINFMCHENFTMDFGQHVTFVSGTNGSGKSAVLQALQCCLGVRAGATGRARSFQKLIRTGSNEAIIRVTVYNRPYKGFDSYRHSLFGDTITVERRIGRAGSSSSYALKDASGRIQGRKREDLDAMLQTLGLNAANPVCVMTQDTARNFLAGSSSKADQEKYQLYMEATSLEQIAYNLEVSKDQVRQMNESVQQIREEYEAMSAAHVALQKSIKALEGIQGWRVEVEQLEQVLSWAVVEDQAAGAAQVQAALDSMPARLQELERALTELTQEHGSLRQATDDKGQFLAAYNERATALATEQEGAKQTLKLAHRLVRATELRVQRLRGELQEAQAHKEALEGAVREVQEDVVQATQAAVTQYQLQLEQAQAADEACREEVAAADAAQQAASATHRSACERAHALEQQRFGADRTVKAVQQQMQQIKEAGRSKVANFGGRAVASLVAAVQRAKGQFSRPPIGPLGVHLTLDDNRWALAVESALGLQLNSFLVHSYSDSQLLRQMISQHFPHPQALKPSVYVADFDTPPHIIPPASQPPPSVASVYRVLACADKRLAAPILNSLVDHAHIEKLALGASIEQCKEIAWRMQGVMACFAPDGSKYYKKGSSHTQTPPPHWLRYARLGQSSAQQTTELAAEVQRMQQEVERLGCELQQARAEVAAAAQEEARVRAAAAPVRQRQWQARGLLTQLTQQPPPELFACNQADDDDATQAELWKAAQGCVDLEQQLRELGREAEAAQAALVLAQQGMQEKREAIARLNEENEAFVSSYDQQVQQLAAVAGRLEDTRAAEEDQRAKRGQLEALATQQAQMLSQLEEGAAKICSREVAAEARREVEARLRSRQDLTEEQVAALMTAELLHKKIKVLERKIAEHEREAGGSLPEVQDAFAASTARMGREGRRAREALSMFQVIEDALKLRVRKLSELDHRLEDLVNAKFRAYMWKKGHSGMIKLDRKAQSLQLKVQIGSKGSKEAGGAVKDLKQLSGGERSYTTVAFTLALGGHTEMPFRAMDEFDVFMDAINRRVAMQNLFDFARENGELQFIFLTPQDISAVEDARQACQQQGQQMPAGFVRVVTMRPPRANAIRA